MACENNSFTILDKAVVLGQEQGMLVKDEHGYWHMTNGVGNIYCQFEIGERKLCMAQDRTPLQSVRSMVLSAMVVEYE